MMLLVIGVLGVVIGIIATLEWQRATYLRIERSRRMHPSWKGEAQGQGEAWER